ncbi:glycoside hydrolase family 30 protein [Alkalihalobacterium bogoriense]|uniref:glycoside hydrolase family 30 protein n=1 Tax=Alkalihalobacterium bogoriense TaxID=246272 RepID=UPI00047EDD56|nr:glycoside hydrolase family 30 protein [Alkalihalobacterium bogoriense]
MPRKMRIVESNKNQKKKWEEKAMITFVNQSVDDKHVVSLNPDRTFQQWMGFGGAFTEAAAYSLAQISPRHRQEVLDAYFDKNIGLGYTLGRTHIHSCDFALENYTYVDEGDKELASFSIEREWKYVIPLIKEAMAIANEPLTILASPWSPPAWMKTNGEMNNGGKLIPEYRQVWANYYVKYIKEMEKAGVPIWGVSVQNEPEAVQVWDSCIYTAEEERDFVKDFLGPTLHKHDLSDKQIVIWDHNRDVIVERATTVLEDPEAAKYVWGIGNHWYVSEEFENLSKVHEAFPDKHLLFTEGCIEGGVKIGEWHTGERYARNIIGDMNHWLEGFIDWNIVLDEKGGPNHVGNYCDAPIIVDTKKDVVYYNSSYYAIGHFSRFIKRGAVRIEVDSNVPNISIIAFKQQDEIVVVVLNETDKNEKLMFSIDEESAEVIVTAHSIVTYVIH